MWKDLIINDKITDKWWGWKGTYRGKRYGKFYTNQPLRVHIFEHAKKTLRELKILDQKLK